MHKLQIAVKSPAPNMSLKEHDVQSIAENIPKDRKKVFIV